MSEPEMVTGEIQAKDKKGRLKNNSKQKETNLLYKYCRKNQQFVCVNIKSLGKNLLIIYSNSKCS